MRNISKGFIESTAVRWPDNITVSRTRQTRQRMQRKGHRETAASRSYKFRTMKKQRFREVTRSSNGLP